MSHNDDGLTIARERIAEEARTRTGSLDLRMLGLDELPAELFGLTFLRRLNLGGSYWDAEGNQVDRASWIAPNRLDSQLHRLAALPDLCALSLSGTTLTTLAGIAHLRTLESLDCTGTQVSDLSPVGGLSALQTLNITQTQVSNLSPLSGLSALQTLVCSGTHVKALSPLSGLSALQTLYCDGTQIKDLSPLSGLTALQTFHCSRCFLETIPEDFCLLRWMPFTCSKPKCRESRSRCSLRISTITACIPYALILGISAQAR